MALTAQDKAAIIDDITQAFGKSKDDTGCAEVQIALLTHRIKYLTDHFRTHKKDHASRRGLLKLVGQRRKLQKYLKNRDPEVYQKLIQRLGLRR